MIYNISHAGNVKGIVNHYKSEQKSQWQWNKSRDNSLLL